MNLPSLTLKQRAVILASIWLPHLALIYAVLFEFDSPHLVPGLLLLAVMFLLTGFGVEAGFHRLLSHRAFQSRKTLKIALLAFGSMAAQGPVLAWVANHRRHHLYSDTQGDPHSPSPEGPGVWNHFKGMYHAHFGWFLTVGQPSVLRFAPDLLMDRSLLRLNRTYWYFVGLGVLLPAAALGLWTQSIDGFMAGMLWGGLVRICLTHNALGSINSVCHRYGSRPFKVPDNSTNNYWLTIPTLGLSLHNNHHAHPQAVSTSFAWWQLDISGVLLRILRTFGLVTYS